jgi:hypothetical protein
VTPQDILKVKDLIDNGALRLDKKLIEDKDEKIERELVETKNKEQMLWEEINKIINHLSILADESGPDGKVTVSSKSLKLIIQAIRNPRNSGPYA